MSELARTDAPTHDPHAIRAIRDRLVRRLVTRILANLSHGSLALHLPGGQEIAASGVHPGPSAALQVHRARTARRMLFAGAPGLADSYIDGDWDTDDLTSVIAFGAANIDGIENAAPPLKAMRTLARFSHLRRANTRSGSRRNIAAHYDLGNAFYEKWLDPGMTYSSACFSDDAQDLSEAQTQKFDRLAGQLDLQDGDHVLEIGCGWGSFARHAAREYGCRVTALTVSPAQAEWARARNREAGLDGQIEVRLQDYRDVGGEFDKIASIEMFEAVGERFWPVFFDTVAARLRAGGRAALQVITIDEARFEAYRRNPDFIQLRVFPGGMLPSRTVFEESANASGLRVDAADMFGTDYAETLRRWRDAFEAAWPEIAKMGFDTPFRRLWRYYLCYCEAGFQAGHISVGQFRLAHA